MCGKTVPPIPFRLVASPVCSTLRSLDLFAPLPCGYPTRAEYSGFAACVPRLNYPPAPNLSRARTLLRDRKSIPPLLFIFSFHHFPPLPFSSEPQFRFLRQTKPFRSKAGKRIAPVELINAHGSRTKNRRQPRNQLSPPSPFPVQRIHSVRIGNRPVQRLSSSLLPLSFFAVRTALEPLRRCEPLKIGRSRPQAL